MIKRRFAALGQAGSGAQIGTTLKAQNENANLHQKAVGDLAGQQLQADMQSQELKEARDFQSGMADKDMALKREFFDREQGNVAKQMDLAERQFAFDKETTEFNKRMAELESNRKAPGLFESTFGFDLKQPLKDPGKTLANTVAPLVTAPMQIIGGGGGGCFLTTAACDVMGLKDDCWVLESARKFRDEYMAKDEERAREIVEYYEIAPEVAATISGREDGRRIWKSLFWKHIVPFAIATKLSNSKAHELYKELIAKAKEYAKG